MREGANLDQLIQIIGAILILAGYALEQFRILKTNSLTYLLLNFVGSAILTVLAWQTNQWGFLLLEVVWALISFWGLFKLFMQKNNRAQR